MMPLTCGYVVPAQGRCQASSPGRTVDPVTRRPYWSITWQAWSFSSACARAAFSAVV